MARRVDWFGRLASAADRIDKWEREAERAARDLARYRRPDLVADAERRGRNAERRLREAQRDYTVAERNLSRPSRAARGGARRSGPPVAPERLSPRPVEYLISGSYGDRHKRIVFEFRIVPPDGRDRPNAEIRRQVLSLAMGDPAESGWSVIALRYGTREDRMRAKPTDNFDGLLPVLRSSQWTIGVEERE